VANSGGTCTSAGEVLRVEGLTVQYGALVALRDVSWSVHANEILIMARTALQEQLLCSRC
jgi:branched-chain amino acid transport system ATP-binding protein